ncbi:MAG: hypothetical protein AAF632_03165 [Bacteroidota bacterium]
MPAALTCFIFTGFIGLIGYPAWAQLSFVEAFQRIGDSTYTVSFQNTLTVNREGGHIQGIQWVGGSFLLSGSSSTVSYYATVTEGEVTRVDTLLHRPYKHAGGFQVNDRLLAIGVEDNEAKNISQVLVYDFSNPADPVSRPVQVIQREGEVKRATAGCVAIAEYREHYVLLVGDWDIRHLDLYQIPTTQIGDADVSSTQTQSITLEDHLHDDWIDNNWWPYQNINLFNSEDSLYLVGLGVNDQKENVADVFTVDLEPELKLTKVASKTFPEQHKISFLWGAGVNWNPEMEQMRIFATPYTIDSENSIMVYQ